MLGTVPSNAKQLYDMFEMSVACNLILLLSTFTNLPCPTSICPSNVEGTPDYYSTDSASLNISFWGEKHVNKSNNTEYEATDGYFSAFPRIGLRVHVISGHRKA